MKKILMQFLVGSCFLIFSQTLFAVTIDKIISFGDSLSDNGNIFTFTSNANKLSRLFPVIPKNPPYFNGRFTNGPVWAENVAQALGVPLSDYAYAGAWAEGVWDSGEVIPFGLNMQVNFYLMHSVLDFHKDQHLYTIWVGSNDYIAGRKDEVSATNKTITMIEKDLRSLIYYGGKNFLLFTLPDLGQVPQSQMYGNDYVQHISKMVALHNDKLRLMMADVKRDYPDVNLMLVDISAYFDQIINHTADFNAENSVSIKNVFDACYGGGYYFRSARLADDPAIKVAKENKLDIAKNPVLELAYHNGKLAASGQKSCQNPDEYLFWDMIHPTKIIHQSIATLVLKTLNNADIKPTHA